MKTTIATVVAILLFLFGWVACTIDAPTGVHRERARIEYEEAVAARDGTASRSQSSDTATEAEGTVGIVLGVLDRLLVAAGAIWGTTALSRRRRRKDGRKV